jgi:hypothetical protein
MNLKPAIFGAAFAALSLASIDARAATIEIGIFGDNTVVKPVKGHADTIAASPVPGFSNLAMMLAGFAGLGLSGYRRKARSFAA